MQYILFRIQLFYLSY